MVRLKFILGKFRCAESMQAEIPTVHALWIAFVLSIGSIMSIWSELMLQWYEYVDR